MQLIRSLVRGVLNRVARSNPERLWMHYSIALLIIFALLFTTHVVNRKIIERGSAAVAAIKAGNSQVLLAYETILLGDDAIITLSQNMASLGMAINEFEQKHENLMATT